MGRTKSTPGPKPVEGGSVRINVQLPRKMIPFVEALQGRSMSAKVVTGLKWLQELDKATKQLLSEGF